MRTTGGEITGGSGLLGLQDRVAAVDGELTVTSVPGAGTSVVATAPVRWCLMNRVVLADDAVLIRDALAGLLRQEGFEVIAEVGDADSLLAAVDADRPDVAVLLLSQHLESHCLTTLLSGDARGVGYLLKERVTGVADFLDAVRRVAGGGCAIDPEVVALMLHARRSDDRLATLAERECDVLALMAQGRSNQAISQALFLTPKTVESHVRNILLRLDLPPEPNDHRRVLAVLTYLRAHPESR